MTGRFQAREGEDSRPERANFRPGRADFGLEREDYRSESPEGERMNGRMYKSLGEEIQEERQVIVAT